MPTWDQLLQVVAQQNAYDQLRKQYIRKLSKLTNRNVICYYSGWLQKPNINGDFSISDQDKTGFMTCMYDEKERKKGLDLILHTPGGDVGATESLIDYLNTLYEGNIRTIVPQIAMSGGTLLALSGKEIVMGSQSSLGPVDPQYGGMAVQSYLDEFDRANKEVVNDKTKEAVWQMIIGQFHPGFLTWCERAMEWSVEVLETVLKKLICCEMMIQKYKILKSYLLIRGNQKLIIDTLIETRQGLLASKLSIWKIIKNYRTLC